MTWEAGTAASVAEAFAEQVAAYRRPRPKRAQLLFPGWLLDEYERRGLDAQADADLLARAWGFEGADVTRADAP